MNSKGEVIGKVKQLQDQGINKSIVNKSDRVACSIMGPTYEKDFNNGEVLYANIPERDFIKIKNKLKNFMNEEDVEVLKEIMKIKRIKNVTWGMG